MATDKNDVFFTKQEVSKLLRVSIKTIDNYCDKGLLKPMGVGRRVLFRKTDVYNAVIEI